MVKMVIDLSTMVHDKKGSIRPLNDALRKVAETELNETPERMVNDLKILKVWIKNQPELHKFSKNDQLLINLLRGSKYNMEKTQRKIKMIISYREILPEFYGNRDPFDPEIQEMLKLGSFLPIMKNRSDASPRPIIARPGLFCQSGRSLVQFLKLSLMIVEILILEDDNFVIAGQNSVSDLKGMVFSDLLQVTPSLAKKTLSCVEDTLSVRLKSVQAINPLYGLSIAVAIVKMFMSAKAKKRIIIHNDMDSLYKHFDKSILPVEYGGSSGRIQVLTEFWKHKVESYREWFLE